MTTQTHIGSLAARAPRILLAVAFALLALALSAAAAHAKPIPGQYIVTVRAGHDARGIAGDVGAKPKHVYGSALNGFAAELNDGQLKALRHNPRVERVEQDAEISAAATTQSLGWWGEPWGLDRIDQRDMPLSGTYSYNKDGDGVRAYVVDTGLQADHPQFGGRAMNVYNATSGSAGDCDGHGTHVAGTIGASTYGVAKKAYLRGVKVLGCDGRGTWADFIEGVDWVADNHIKPAVANISIEGPAYSTANTAVRNLVDTGVFVAVAAGNGNVDACTISPASTASAYTTAASTRSDAKRASSNWGGCVDGYAPGQDVLSSTLGGGAGYMSGTSMASPHAAGVGALLCSFGSSSCAPSYIKATLDFSATRDKISGSPSGTPNLLLFKGGL